MKISDQLRQLADQLDATGTGGPNSTGHVLAETGPDYPTFDDAGICTDDYWVRGRIGCMKNARLSDYSICFTMSSLMGGADVPKHLFTVSDPALGPVGASGMQLLASVADAGWMDGTKYRPMNPPGQNYHDWNAAGRPSGNQFGKYGPAGEFMIEGRFSPAR